MQKFPILSMRKGDDVTVMTRDGMVQGLVEDTSNVPGEGFAVLVKVFNADYEWFYVRKGAEFYR